MEDLHEGQSSEDRVRLRGRGEDHAPNHPCVVTCQACLDSKHLETPIMSSDTVHAKRQESGMPKTVQTVPHEGRSSMQIEDGHSSSSASVPGLPIAGAEVPT